MTKFSWEVPLKHLSDFDEDQDYLFTLSFLYNNPIYTKYILNRNSNTKLILDNSYNETMEPGDPMHLVELSEEYGADYIICPDDDNWDLDKLISVYKDMELWVSKFNLLLVTKTNNECGWAHNNNQRFCVTYEQRFKLKKEWLYKATHFLGLNNYWECYQFKPQTCDTSMPIKLAMENKTIEDWYKHNFKHPKTTPDYFNQTMTDRQITLAKQNIKTLRECTNGTKKLQISR
jgi:hypothetical protein